MLILSGVVYTLVGIKNKTLHVSLSAAYIASLSVTVLIIYVMNLPVSNGSQGAYLVAIVLTGLIFGGASLIFTEMTEGLGCLLGGFCFSMWLLVLKPGGLVTEQSSKCIFIAVFTFAGFSTSFSHYTRPYGLIGGVSFAGATVVMLGVDCFSRAGLKEFWAYVWELNDVLFPIGATTYPITRGMKVEIAAIIFVFLAGVISQMKLWKVIKERREQRALEHLNDQRSLEKEEENVGNAIEHAAAEDRDQWEAVYGNKEGTKSFGPPTSIQDSGVGDMESKKSARSEVVSLRKSDETIEMAPMPSDTSKTSAGLVLDDKVQDSGAITVFTTQDPTPRILDGNGSPIEAKSESHSSLRNSVALNQKEEKSWVVGADGEARLERPSSLGNSKRLSTGPDVVPLPFKIPENEVTSSRSSVATFADDEDGANNKRSKHLSTGSIQMRKPSRASTPSRQSPRNSKISTAAEGVSTEDLVIPRSVEDDRASSIAATADGFSDDEDLKSIRSSADNGPDTTDSVLPDQSAIPSVFESPKKSEKSAHGDANRRTSVAKVATISTERVLRDEDEPEQLPVAVKSRVPSTEPQMDTLPVKENSSEANKSDAAPSTTSTVESKMVSITKERLPPQVSKVVMSYRTNEWAKHLSGAEPPELDELKLAEHSVENNAIAESAAPVNVEELQQTPEKVLPRPVSRTISQTSNRGIEGNLPSTTPPASKPTGAYTAFGPTLLGKRDSMIRSKTLHTTTHSILPSTPELSQPLTHHGSRDAGSLYQYPNTAAIVHDDDDMPLSARRRELKRQAPLHPPPTHLLQTQQNLIYDSHQPKRQTGAPHPALREQQLASWRAGVQQGLHANASPKTTLERSRYALLVERQLEAQRRAVQERMKGARDQRFDERMRRGDMLDAHRDALRRMQASANKHV